MGLCYSLRSRLAAAHPSAPYGGPADAAPPAAAGEHGDPQVRHRLRQDLVAKERADKKRSKSIDKTLKAEKREYKQTHRLLLLGEARRERGGAAGPGRCGADRAGPAPAPTPFPGAAGRGAAAGSRRAGAPGPPREGPPVRRRARGQRRGTEGARRVRAPRPRGALGSVCAFVLRCPLRRCRRRPPPSAQRGVPARRGAGCSCGGTADPPGEAPWRGSVCPSVCPGGAGCPSARLGRCGVSGRCGARRGTGTHRACVGVFRPRTARGGAERPARVGRGSRSVREWRRPRPACAGGPEPPAAAVGGSASVCGR